MAAPMEQRINVPIDDPNADTEWNDILRKQGIIPEKPPSPTPMIEEAILEARRLAHENRLEGKELDELDELEDEEDEEFLNKYRNQRLQELNSLAQKGVHGSVYHISRPEYAKEVTEASNTYYVLVLMTSSLGTNTESRVMTELFRTAAVEFPEIKFCDIKANLAVPNYPEKNCPTVLIYHNGDIVKQVVTLMTLKGVRTSLSDIDDILVEIGAVKDNDMRIVKRRRGNDSDNEERKAKDESDDDDDW
ncbi:thioredoxin-like protein [Xylogone sp. PMI_703]|nr:thioredoxin-like protein [Xylogone sp. PMI_703]